MKRLIIIFLLAIAMGFMSCRSVQYVPVETVKTEYKTRDSIRYDSIYHRDSVFLYKNGDTVHLYKYKYLYRYLIINKTDTVIKNDSIRVPYPVETPLSRWQAIKMELGGWAFGIILIFMFYWLIFKFKKYL